MPVICTRYEKDNTASCECRETHYEKLCAVASHVRSFCTQTGCVAAQQATPSGGDDQCSCHQLGQSMSYAVQHSILPMPDISQAWKKEDSNLTSKERFSSLVGRTVEAYIADAFVAMPVASRIRTGNIQENVTADTFLWHKDSRSLPKLIMTCLASGYGLQSCGALVTGPLNDLEEGSIPIGRAQKVVISMDFIHGRLREGHPTLTSPTEQPCMQTTIVKGHTIPLAALL